MTTCPLSPYLKLRLTLSLLAGIAVLTGCRGESRLPRGEFRDAPVIVISVDTLRSDHLPAYGYKAGATPAIDELARDGVLFERAYAQVPLTLPSHATILTGLLPNEHGVRNNIGYSYDVKKHPAISTALKGAGYDTAAVVSAYVLRGNTGLSAAFDYYDDAIASESGVPIGRLQRAGDLSYERARQWIAGRNGRPFFLLFHTFEPHSPYTPPEPFKSRHALPYDGEVAAADAVVGKLIACLKEADLYDRSIIVLLSDHGEGLGDHGEDEHGVFLYREALQVPLIIKLPRSVRGGERVARPVQLADVAPTIAHLTGVETFPSNQGLDILDSKALEPNRRLYAETLYPRLHLGWSELRSMVDEQYHYIESPKPELFDLLADPAERKNVLSDQRRVYASLRDTLATHDRAIAAPGAIDPEEASKLAALGYVGSVRDSEGDLPDPKDRIGDFGLLKTAMKISAEGRLAEAEAILKQILASNPKFSDASALLATTYERMARYEDAIKVYRKGLEASPASSAEFGLSMAALFQKLHRLDDARKHAELALGRNPAGARQMLARIAMDAEDYAEAERQLSQAPADEATAARTRVTLAQLRKKQGRFDEALRILEQARAEANERQMRVEYLEYSLGDLYATMDRPVVAEAAFRREIGMFPNNLTAYSSLAVVLVLQKKYDEVDPLFAEMARANPTRQAYLVAAETYAVLGDNRSAAAWRKKASGAR